MFERTEKMALEVCEASLTNIRSNFICLKGSLKASFLGVHWTLSLCDREKRAEQPSPRVSRCPHGQRVRLQQSWRMVSPQTQGAQRGNEKLEAQPWEALPRRERSFRNYRRRFHFPSQFLMDVSAPNVTAFCYLSTHLSAISLLLFMHLLWLAMFFIESTHPKLEDHTKQCCW